MKAKESGNGTVSLTGREQQIVGLIWKGLQNREIATELRISQKTVEAHRASMMRKLRATNAAQLLKSCFERGFLRQPGRVA
ncbi:MAG TPA: LuxR C-terminal-related transcriptional regulator [Nitrospirales bacterium]